MMDPTKLMVARMGHELAASHWSRLFASSSSAHNCDVREIEQVVDNLRRKLQRIQARLNDAENLEINNESVRHWLRELQGTAYAAEDVLDELHYEELRLQLEDGGFTDAVAPRLERMALLQKINEINSRFEGLTQDKFALLINENLGQRFVAPSVRQPTSSLIRKSCIYGRDNDLRNIKEFLFNEESNGINKNVSVIAITGMGGLGKTAVAQLAYNDDAVSKHFDKRLWVCASENFDVTRLTRAMMESLTGEACGLSELSPLHEALKKKLDGQKLLMVVDDVWEQDNLRKSWETLQLPLLGVSKGSKIIITTRSDKASRIIGAISSYHLPYLRDDDCLKLFNEWAFGGWVPDSSPILSAIWTTILKKCKGLPLLAKTLGGLLHCKDDDQMWVDVLVSDIWDIDRENGIMPVLELSYRHLPTHLKRCFRFCSVFPKDYEFDKDQLVKMWIAQGYIKEKGRKLLQDIGEEYFDDLLCRSFFQCSQNRKTFLMHDLIHDLARHVSQGECYTVENNGSAGSIPGYVVHISAVSISHLSDILSLKHGLESINFRSFLFFHSLCVWNYHTEPDDLLMRTKYVRDSCTALDDLLMRTKHLRVLDLSHTGLGGLPDSIGCLKHLRYLGLRANPIEQLPESVGSLYNLETLDLTYCRIMQLPDSLPKLLKLRHLICEKNITHPVGIGKLADLETMPGFAVSTSHGHANLGELRDINSVRSLVISSLNKLTNVDEVKKACLEKKQLLCTLDLTWESGKQQESPIDVDEVLESLRPNPRLETLRISYFKGQFLPSWLGDCSFSRLVNVELRMCRNFSCLPPLGQLLSLKHLCISGAVQVEHIDQAFFSGGFPQLESLRLEYMGNLKSWCGAQKGQCPRLRELFIVCCGNLASLSVTNLGALQNLGIKECRKLQFSLDSLQLGQLPFLQIVDIRSIQGAKYVGQDFFSGGFLSLKSLKLADITEWQTWSSAWKGECPHLQELSVASCGNLASLSVINLDALRNVDIKDCPELQFSLESLQLGQLPSLCNVSIEGIKGAESIGHNFFSGGFPSLKKLKLGRISEWERWCDPVGGECSFLQELIITGCPNLMSLPNLENINSLKHLKISECPRLHFSDQTRLPSKLQVLDMHGCPSLTEWFQHHRLRLKHIQTQSVEGIDPPVVIHNAFTLQQIKEDCLLAVHRLRTLELKWACDSGLRSGSNLKPEEALDILCPHNNLNKLLIIGYMGSRFATWVGDASFCHLSHVALLGCSKCEFLPPLGQLPYLMELHVSGAQGVRTIGHEFFNGSCSIGHGPGFPSLERLELNDMPNWEDWDTEYGCPPCLCELILKHCPKLKALPHLPPSLKELDVVACNEITFPHSFNHLTSLRTLRISQVPILKKLPELPSGLNKLVVQNLPALVDLVLPPTVRDLVVEGCSEAMVAASIEQSSLLTSLRISYVPRLVELKFCNLLMLQELHVSGCPELTSLECIKFSPSSPGDTLMGLQSLPSLERLSISNCPRLHISADHRPPSYLQSMDIINCPSAAAWYDRHWRNCGGPRQRKGHN